MREIDIDIGFEWYRDEKGYDLLPELIEKPKSKSRSTLLSGGGRRLPTRVARRGGKEIAYQPLTKRKELYLLFANLPNRAIESGGAAAVLDFVERFGPLTEKGREIGGYDTAEMVIHHAYIMRAFLNLGARDPQAIAGISEMRRLGELDFGLVYDPATKSFELRYTPRSLLVGLWLQAGYALAGGAIVRQCRHCGVPFAAGTGKRRADAQFCTATHQAAFKSLKRSKGSAEHA